MHAATTACTDVEEPQAPPWSVRRSYAHPRSVPRPRPLYAVSDVARVLRFAEDEVRRRIADDSIDAVERDGEPLVPWEELIAAAVDERWTPRLLAEALPPRAVPRLARSASGMIVLPLYLWRLLRAVARDLAAAEDR